LNDGHGTAIREGSARQTRQTQTETKRNPKPIHRLILDEAGQDINGWLFAETSESASEAKWNLPLDGKFKEAYDSNQLTNAIVITKART
jgi:hypothetical protein